MQVTVWNNALLYLEIVTTWLSGLVTLMVFDLLKVQND